MNQSDVVLTLAQHFYDIEEPDEIQTVNPEEKLAEEKVTESFTFFFFFFFFNFFLFKQYLSITFLHLQRWLLRCWYALEGQ